MKPMNLFFLSLTALCMLPSQTIRSEEVERADRVLFNENFEDGDPLIAGLHQDIRGRLYPTFIEKKKNISSYQLSNNQVEAILELRLQKLFHYQMILPEI